MLILGSCGSDAAASGALRHPGATKLLPFLLTGHVEKAPSFWGLVYKIKVFIYFLGRSQKASEIKQQDPHAKYGVNEGNMISAYQ